MAFCEGFRVVQMCMSLLMPMKDAGPKVMSYGVGSIAVFSLRTGLAAQCRSLLYIAYVSGGLIGFIRFLHDVLWIRSGLMQL